MHPGSRTCSSPLTPFLFPAHSIRQEEGETLLFAKWSFGPEAIKKSANKLLTPLTPGTQTDDHGRMTSMKSVFRIALALTLLASFAVLSLARSDTPAPAKVVLANAQLRAKAAGKQVFVGFTASWCGWCKRMAKTLADPKIDAIMDKYFITVWLDTLEQAEKKNLENPGAGELMKAMGGENQGIPFWYFTDAAGKKIVDSMIPGEDGKKAANTGCPYEAPEIAYWLKSLKTAAPKISAEELDAMKTAFEALKKADGK